MNKITIEQAEFILGIKKSEPLENIKKQYHVVSKKFHPDKIGDNNKIYEINMAYTLLKEYKEKIKNPVASNFKVVDDATVYSQYASGVSPILKNLNPEIKKTFEEILFIFNNFLLNSNLMKNKSEEEIVKLINESLKLAFKFINKKLTQEYKYELIKMIIQKFNLKIDIDKYLKILNIKKKDVLSNFNSTEPSNANTPNNEIIKATCSVLDFNKIIKDKKVNVQINLENGITKLLTLKFIYILNQDTTTFLLCTDNKGKTYKIYHR